MGVLYFSKKLEEDIYTLEGLLPFPSSSEQNVHGENFFQ